MNIKQFARKVQDGVSKLLEEEAEVSVREVRKNNGVTLHGLMILKKDQNVSPTIYLDTFLELYEQGMSLSEVVSNIMSVYESGMPRQKVDMEFFREFSKVKDKIVYKLVNADKNRELLKQIPHICFLDLAICFCYAYYHKTLGNGTIMIYNTHVAMWNTNTVELMRLAKKNAPRLSPPECNSMETVLAELAEETQEESIFTESCFRGDSKGIPMHILSNEKRTYGAACILYPGMLQQISESFSKDFYILPSSIHEVILLADDGWEEPEHLKEMVREVNATQVEPEEILSDNVYYYDHIQKEMRII